MEIAPAGTGEYWMFAFDLHQEMSVVLPQDQRPVVRVILPLSL